MPTDTIYTDTMKAIRSDYKSQLIEARAKREKMQEKMEDHDALITRLEKRLEAIDGKITPLVDRYQHYVQGDLFLNPSDDMNVDLEYKGKVARLGGR